MSRILALFIDNSSPRSCQPLPEGRSLLCFFDKYDNKKNNNKKWQTRI